MFYVVVLACLVASVFGAPANTDVVPLEKQQPTVIPIVSQSDELEPNGTYHFSYETGNGIKRDEISYDKMVPKAQGRSSDSNEGGEDSNGDSDGIHVQIGSYSYTAPDGTVISVRYIADENGFQPIGDHIPRVPTASGSSSGEKSGRALKATDNVESASAPKVASRSSAPAPSAAASSTAAPEENETSTTEAAKTTEGTSASESSSTESSTTEAGSTEGASTAASTTEAASTTTTETSTTSVADASTPAADASTTTAEPSTTNGVPSTTEAASPTTAAA